MVRGTEPKRPHLVLHRVELVITAPTRRCHTPAPARTSTKHAGLLLRSLLLLLLSLALLPLPLLLLLPLALLLLLPFALLPLLLLPLSLLLLLPLSLLTLALLTLALLLLLTLALLLLLTLALLLLLLARRSPSHSRGRPLVHIREAATTLLRHAAVVALLPTHVRRRTVIAHKPRRVIGRRPLRFPSPRLQGKSTKRTVDRVSPSRRQTLHRCPRTAG